MRFATRILLLQLALVAAVVAVCTAVFLVLGVQQLRAESESSALNIARTVAEDPDVRALVAGFSQDPGVPDAAQLRDGALQQIATSVAERTDALFVVITDDHGIRLAHPNQELLGEVVSTPFAEVIAGNEVVDWERGTLGESARAKVPVWPLTGDAAVGEVSVGFERASVFDDLPILLASIALAAAGALGLAVLATVLMRRRWERVTLGLQPEDLVALVQNQAAVLDGVGDGVIALDEDGVVRVCNAAAGRMLGLSDPVGRTLTELGVPAEVLAAAHDGRAHDGIAWGDRILYLDAQPVRREGRDLGEILIVRDRTDVVALSERLDTVRAMTGALRVQRHEFANRMHVATGLIDAGRATDAREFLAEQLERSPVDIDVPGIALVADPFIQSFLGAKAIELAERGIALSVGDETLVIGSVADVEDVATILGNLIDNAATAAARNGTPAWVEVGLLTDGSELVLTVADSGQGVAPDADVFGGRAVEDAPADAIHGLGIGLPLSRDIARRAGGDVWLIDAGGGGAGAVFGARLPAVMTNTREGSE
ncbi:ATP-binding protein [Microbacterium sp.]|uniref:sensor histidine kinase n=1 Tax=Microbacterium sp. TaxID=51671 RepID=UPI003F706CCC